MLFGALVVFPGMPVLTAALGEGRLRRSMTVVLRRFAVGVAMALPFLALRAVTLVRLRSLLRVVRERFL